jgi:thiol-disulfide isomerase/thioredoxin
MRYTASLALFLAAGISAWASDSGCAASAEAQTVLDQLRIPVDITLSEAAKRDADLSLLRKALQATPRDLFLNQRYQDALSSAFQPGRAIEEYEAALAKHPGDALFLYLAGRAEYGHRTTTAIAHLESALQQDPQFAPPHLLLGEIRQYDPFRDDKQVAAHLDAYDQLCPQSLEVSQRLRWNDDKALIARTTGRVRKAIQGRSDGAAILAYTRLWYLEGALLPSDRQGPWKEQVKQDLSLILKPEVRRDQTWYSAVSTAADILADRKSQESALQQMAERFPKSGFPAQLANSEWTATHRYPNGGTKEQEQAYYRASWEHWREMEAKWPSLVWVTNSAWRFATFWDGTTKDDLAAAAKRFIAALQENPHAMMTSPPVEIETAEAMVRRDALLDQVPALVIRGFGVTEEQFSAETQSDLYAASSGMSMKDAWYLFGYLPLAEAYVKLGRVTDAKDTLSQTEDKLAKVRPREGASAEEKFRHNEMEARYWDIKGQLAEKEGRKLDALVDYRTSMSLYPPRRPRADTRDEVMARAQRLWKEMGGTDRGWSDWATTASLLNFNAGSGGANAWKTLAATKPGITLTDFVGKTWTTADLASKTTLVAIWATWCGPCREELPYFAKLYEKYKGRNDVAVLALNVDEDPKAMDAYLKKNGLQVPSIAARDFAYDFLPVMAIPSNWLITPEKSQMLTSNYDTGEQWLEIASKAIEGAPKIAR